MYSNQTTRTTVTAACGYCNLAASTLAESGTTGDRNKTTSSSTGSARAESQEATRTFHTGVGSADCDVATKRWIAAATDDADASARRSRAHSSVHDNLASSVHLLVIGRALCHTNGNRDSATTTPTGVA